ncbi:hypothetical protein AAZX31_06G174400 [Glycine max]
MYHKAFNFTKYKISVQIWSMLRINLKIYPELSHQYFGLRPLEAYEFSYQQSKEEKVKPSSICLDEQTTISENFGLIYLNLDYCKNRMEFSLISKKKMKQLRLQWTKVKAFPSSFGYQSKLKSSLLLGSSHIERLPSSIKSRLLHLDSGCYLKVRHTPRVFTLESRLSRPFKGCRHSPWHS